MDESPHSRAVRSQSTLDAVVSDGRHAADHSRDGHGGIPRKRGVAAKHERHMPAALLESHQTVGNRPIANSAEQDITSAELRGSDRCDLHDVSVANDGAHTPAFGPESNGMAILQHVG